MGSISRRLMSLGLSRRRFLKLCAAGAIGCATTGAYAWQIEPHWVKVDEVAVALNHLPASWRGRRIVQLSDIHVGPRVSDSYLFESFETVKNLRPDLLVLTGDYISGFGVSHVLEIMQRLPRPPLGVLACLGNHDYGPSCRRPEMGDRISAGLRRMGVDVLRNAARVIDGLRFIGSEDLWAPTYDPDAITKLVAGGGSADCIALCHNPDAMDRPEWASFRGWTLAGHTHGGQCRMPGFKPPFMPVRNRRYVAGRYNLGPERKLYINRGLGHLMQVRFHVRPEITVHTLV